MIQEPENTVDTGRNPDGTWKPGFCPNPGGRPRNPLKDYLREKFNKMTDIEKEEFLSKISPELQFRMAEGNPHNTEDITSKGEKIIPIYGSISGHIKPKEDIQPAEENKSS